MNKKTIEDVIVRGKKVLVRCDFNVPMEDGKITSETRIVGALPTIKYLLDNGARVILCSHMGKPKGQYNEKYSLKPVAENLSEKLGIEVALASDVVGEDAQAKANALKDGEAMLLENVRFHSEEEKNDPEFSKKLASLADLYVNDAFGTAHRAHASTAGVADYLPSVCGYLIQKEISIMGGALEAPKRPLLAILGGAKVSSKIGVINNLMEKVDSLIIGGGMAYTFAKAMGGTIGTSLCEDDKLDLALELLEKAKAKGVKFLLPIDTVASKEYANDTEFDTFTAGQLPDDFMGMDIGPKTVELFTEEIKNAKTIIWNGPMGVFEFDNFSNGTKSIATAVAESGAISIIGGGDSAAAVEKFGLESKITHISTGGGASLEFLEGIALPGIECLDEKRVKVIAGNWKMNKNVNEAPVLVDEVKEIIKEKDVSGCKIIMCVPFTDIAAVKAAAEGSAIKVGAQNVHWAEKGAFTGEISADMLKAVGAEYVIIGHSERRQYFGETDETVNMRVKAALNAGLKVILCVGEVLEQRKSGITEEIVSMQTKLALQGIDAEQAKDIIIAYEPVWAIGTGETATPEQADEVCAVIRNVAGKLYGESFAKKLIVQYGGSMNAGNADVLLAKENVDGGLIGGASLKAPDFCKIIEAAQ